MLLEITETKTLRRFSSKWQPSELEVEKIIVSSSEEDQNILTSAIFGEPLLIISNQVRTKFKKRADILAIDRYGNGVIIELKRDRGALGVETQALQYLADFSAYQGESFIKHFNKDAKRNLEQDILSFIGGNSSLSEINKKSRIILLARDFDPTIFSMGEWLSNNGVSFRCIQYEPTQIEERKFFSFSVAFDRSQNILNPIMLGGVARESRYYWHNIAHADQKWWEFLVENKQIPAGFDGVLGDQGTKILTSYISGDHIIAYAKGYGAVGWGIIEKPDSYHLAKDGGNEDFRDGDCMHRLSINWKLTVNNLSEGVKAGDIREKFGIYHPLSTSVSIDSINAKNLIGYLNDNFQ